MKVKSYFADSVEEAMDKARIELGPDSVLMSSKQTGSDLRDLGQYEVIFGFGQTGASHVAASSASKRQEQGSPGSSSELILREIASLRKDVETYRHSVLRSNPALSNRKLSPELADIWERLLGAGFSSEFAEELTAAIETRMQPHSQKSVRMIRESKDMFTRDLLDALLADEIETRFDVDCSLGKPESAATNVMLVGPSGVGKTTSLVKLGFQYGLKEHRPVRFLSLDSYRLGGWEQLSNYARISGIAFEPLQNPAALSLALAQRSAVQLNLIDTPGFSQAEENELQELASAIKDIDLEVQLVIPATLRLAAASKIFKRFAKFRPAKLLLTNAEEVTRPGELIELAMRAELPVSFLSDGQQVPEDLRRANKAELISKIPPRSRAISTAA